ncbi:methyltransferase domain-containing protein [Candidatus Woesearchaeota archaeon]|nr:methyltransferase domain-containing protein [Candidatus Woesearchaeota archaeon]
MKNSWVKYWEERTEGDEDYFGKHGDNADQIIHLLDIQPGDKVLDIGCGMGTFLTDIQKKVKNVECYGIDISPIPIRMNRNKKIKLQVGNMEALPFKDSAFTKVFSLGVVEHTPRTEKVLKEIARVTKSNGKIFLTVPNLVSMFHLTKRVKMVLGTWKIGYERSFAPIEFKMRLKKTGFRRYNYFIIPHRIIHNIFNWTDNKLNKISNRHFGFFLFATAVKE